MGPGRELKARPLRSVDGDRVLPSATVWRGLSVPRVHHAAREVARFEDHAGAPAMRLAPPVHHGAGEESYSERGRIRSVRIHSRKSSEARWARRQADSCATLPMSLGNGVLSADGVVQTKCPESSS